MSGSGKEIQIGDYVDIRRDDMIIGVFEIVDFNRQENSMVMVLVSDEGDEIILELSPDLDQIIFLSDMFDIDGGEELSVNFIGFNPDFLQGLECETSKDFKKTVKILEDFWSGNENTLDLTELKCNMDIPRYFSHPRIINKLNNLGLVSNGLKSLPGGIGNLENLQILALQDNELTSLPEEMGNLKSLKNLYLTGNQLTYIPEWIEKLQQLEVLYLQNNQLKILPEEIGNLYNLKFLDISYNDLSSLPEMGNLLNLSTIHLEKNPLTLLPLYLGNLPNLKNLYKYGTRLEPGTPKTIPELREAWEKYLEQIRNVKSARKT